MNSTLGEPTGSTSVRGHTWPLYERRVFAISVKGEIEADEGNAETVHADLEARLRGTGLQVEVEPQIHTFMSDGDQAELEKLERSAVSGKR